MMGAARQDGQASAAGRPFLPPPLRSRPPVGAEAAFGDWPGDASPCGLLVERHQYEVEASAEAVYGAFTSLGGERGWLYLNWAWRLRGWLDRLAGGIGLRPGEGAPGSLQLGGVLDCWRVEALEPPRLMRLRSEMKMPGRGWLQFQADRRSLGQSRLTLTAWFEPAGLLGRFYWYLLYPAHRVLFAGLIRRLALAAEHDRSS